MSMPPAPGPDFATLVEQYRAELRIHCYRMLGAFADAAEHVQETMLRAWRRRETFEGRSTLRAWLYRIATNVCLDTLRTHPERVIPVGDGATPPPSEIPWLQPYPDTLLDQATSRDDQPDALVVARETIELAFLAVVQLLPPNQRAVLLLRDVLDWSAAETAALLDTSVASVTSALQRARVTLRQHARAESRVPSGDERQLVARYVDAHHRADTAALVSLMREDIRFTMPPQPVHYDGIRQVAEVIGEALEHAGEFRLVPTRANRSPAAANYLRERGDTEFRALALDVLRFEDGKLVEITTFEPRLFVHFGLPEVWTDEPGVPDSS